jgi:LytTR family transcriptional regulator, CO-responsive transcriptional regulator RcoM
METFQHMLQNFNPGIIWLNSKNHVSAMSSLASSALGVDSKDVVGTHILQLHPETSRHKVKSLLESAECPVKSPPPMAMMINIPDKVLLIKVSKMFEGNHTAGTCMIFYDLTNISTLPVEIQNNGGNGLRLLFKLPVFFNNQVTLLDLEEVIFFKADGHYTNVITNDYTYLCNLSITDLVERLDLRKFIRIHRSYIINVRFAKSFNKVGHQSMILLDDANDTNIPISRSKIQITKEIFGLK